MKNRFWSIRLWFTGKSDLSSISGNGEGRVAIHSTNGRLFFTGCTHRNLFVSQCTFIVHFFPSYFILFFILFFLLTNFPNSKEFVVWNILYTCICVHVHISYKYINIFLFFRLNSAPCKFVEQIEGYVSSCEQKYIYRQLLAVDKQLLTTELFRFPSSCCCSVKFDPSVW